MSQTLSLAPTKTKRLVLGAGESEHFRWQSFGRMTTIRVSELSQNTRVTLAHWHTRVGRPPLDFRPIAIFDEAAEFQVRLPRGRIRFDVESRAATPRAVLEIIARKSIRDRSTRNAA